MFSTWLIFSDGQLQSQFSAIQTEVATSIKFQLDNAILRNFSYAKQFIYCKLIYLLKRLISKQVGVYDTEFLSVMCRHRLEISEPCSFQSFTHIVQHISRTVEHKNTLFLSSLSGNCGAIGWNKKVYVAFENISSFRSWLDVTDVLES